jgi:protoporphyrinogen oxidase
MARTVKVAVIGSGLAGLTAAYLLARSSEAEVEFEVHVFEKVRIVNPVLMLLR